MRLPVVGATLAAALVVVLASSGNGDVYQIHDVSTLPGHISICDRNWVKDILERQSSLEEIRAVAGAEPAVVGIGSFAPCPAGACTAVAQSIPCHTVVYVRVGEDAYMAYELSGGP